MYVLFDLLHAITCTLFPEGHCKIGPTIPTGERNIFIKNLRGIKASSCLENHYCICLVAAVNNNITDRNTIFSSVYRQSELTSYISFLPNIFTSYYSIYVNWYATELFKDSFLSLTLQIWIFHNYWFSNVFLKLKFFHPFY